MQTAFKKFLALTVLLILQVVPISVPPTWITNPYVQADTRYVINYNLTGTLAGSTVTPTATMPFNTAFTSIPNLGYGICNYEGNDFLGQQNFEINKTSLTETQFSVLVQIYGVTNLYFLGIRYFAISLDFPHHLNSFANVPVNYSNGELTNISIKSTAVQTYTNQINYTAHSLTIGSRFNKFKAPYSDFKILLFLTSLFESGTFPYRVQLRIQSLILNDQLYQLKASVEEQISITRLHFSIIIFDQADVQFSGRYFLVYEKFDFPKEGGFRPVPVQFHSNLIAGFVDFSTNSSQTTIHFKINFQTTLGSEGIRMPLSNPYTGANMTFSRFGFTLFYMKSWICDNLTVFNLSSNLCQTCALPGCLQCISIKRCLLCDQAIGYLLDNLTQTCGQLPTICGDGLIYSSEQCDDGNQNNGDGCSSLCTVQADFFCSLDNNTNSTGMSICFYIGQITLNIKFIQKIDGANQIQIMLQVGPLGLAIWNRTDFSSMVSLSDMTGFSSFETKMNSDGRISIYANYNEDIHNRQITVQLDPSKSGQPSFIATPIASKTFIVKPTDNETAIFYDQSVYQMANIISILSCIIGALSLFLFILGILARKLIGIQTVSVIQISYLSLISLSSMNPCFKALTMIWFVNGFNYFSLGKGYLLDQFTPIQVKGIFLYSRFVENYNFTICLILIPLLASLVCFCLGKTIFKSDKDKQNKLVRFARICACQSTYNGVMFSGYIVFVCLALQIRFGCRKMNQIMTVLSIVVCFILTLVYILYFVLKMKFQQYFGEFAYYFKIKKVNKNDDQLQRMSNPSNFSSTTESKNQEKQQETRLNRLNQKWYNILMIERIIVGICLVFFLEIQMQALITICVFIFLTIYTIIFKPYIKLKHNIRFCCNMLICIIVQIIYLAYKKLAVSNDQNHEKIWFLMPFIVCGLLFICVCYNLVMLIVEILQKRKQKKSYRKLDQEQKDFKQIMIEMNKSQTTHRKQSLMSQVNNDKISYILQNSEKMHQKNRILQKVRKELRIKPESIIDPQVSKTLQTPKNKDREIQKNEIISI